MRKGIRVCSGVTEEDRNQVLKSSGNEVRLTYASSEEGRGKVPSELSGRARSIWRRKEKIWFGSCSEEQGAQTSCFRGTGDTRKKPLKSCRRNSSCEGYQVKKENLQGRGAVSGEGKQRRSRGHTGRTWEG